MHWLLKAVFRTAVLGGLIGLMSGCSTSSHLVDVWHSPSYQEPPLSKMLVIAVRKDATKRRIWEDAFTAELAKCGVTTTSSYVLFPDLPPDTNQVIASVKSYGFDCILVTLELPTETNTQYIRGYRTMERDLTYGPYYSHYWNRYRNYYQVIEHPGYVDSQTVDIRAIDLSTTGKNGRLIWSATSRTPEPGSVPNVQLGIVRLVVSDLERKNIISTKL